MLNFIAYMALGCILVFLISVGFAIITMPAPLEIKVMLLSLLGLAACFLAEKMYDR